MGVCCSKVRPDENAVPTLRFTAEWLTVAMRQSGVLESGASVSSIEFKDLGAVASDGTELPNGGGLAGGSVVRHRPTSAAQPSARRPAQRGQRCQPSSRRRATDLLSPSCSLNERLRYSCNPRRAPAARSSVSTRSST